MRGKSSQGKSATGLENTSDKSIEEPCVYMQEDLNESPGLEIFEKLKNQGKLEKTLQEGVLFFTNNEQNTEYPFQVEVLPGSPSSLEESVQERAEYMEEVDQYLQNFMGFLDDDFKPSTFKQDVVPATPFNDEAMGKSPFGGFQQVESSTKQKFDLF